MLVIWNNCWWFVLATFEQNCALYCNAVAVTKCTQFFRCGGGKVDATNVHTQHFGNVNSHLRDVGSKFWCLADDNCRHVYHFETAIFGNLDASCKQIHAVCAKVLVVGIGKLHTDIAIVGGGKHSVADGVSKHVGIAVPLEFFVVGDFYTAQMTKSPSVKAWTSKPLPMRKVGKSPG